MKISNIKITPVGVPLQSIDTQSRFRAGKRILVSVIVEVCTDEGITGIGEAPSVMGGDLTENILNTVEESLIGKNPLHVNRIMKELYVSYNLAHVHLHAANWALNGIEMALWDIIGKVARLPLYEVWGGPFRLEIPYYGHVERQEPEAMSKEAFYLSKAGFKTLYTKVGLNPEEDLTAVEAMRKGANSSGIKNIKIRVDANQSWSPGEAVRMINAMAQYDLEFVDQPVLMYNIDALKRVRESVSVPISAHESGWTFYEVLNVIKNQAADVIHIDPRFDAGLYGARISAGIAEAAGIPVVVHSFGELGVAFTANMHLAAAIPNCTLANQEDGYRYLTDDVITGGLLKFKEGKVHIPDGPGLGVTLDKEKLAYCAEYYQKEIREKGLDRKLRTGLYGSMYLRQYLRDWRNID